jgi:high-affinity iron transporter
VAATFVIFLREGVEASMIVAILLAYLDRTGQRGHRRDVLAGVGLALLLVLVGGVVIYLTITSYAGSRVQAIFETVTYLVAAAVLTWMTWWMQSHAATLASDLRQRTAAALEGRARWGLGILSFQAVGREGMETMVFTLAIMFSASPAHALAGGAGGLAVSLVIAWLLYRMGRRLNIGRIFKVLGVVLMVFAAALLVDAVENLQQLGWVTLWNQPLWHTGRFLNESSALGDILHSFVGYSDAPTALQVVVYAVYAVLAVTGFLRIRRRPPTTRPTQLPADAKPTGHATPVPPRPQ